MDFLVSPGGFLMGERRHCQRPFVFVLWGLGLYAARFFFFTFLEPRPGLTRQRRRRWMNRH